MNNKICRCCSRSLPSIDCNNSYRCFINNKYVDGNSTCNKFRSIQTNNNVSIFNRLFYRVKEIFAKC